MRSIGVLLVILATIGTNQGAGSMLINGDFEAGNVGFSSTYTYSPATTFPEGTYAVIDDPHSIHFNAASFPDHTTGTGRMFVANGSGDSSDIVWSQSVVVSTNRTYVFSGWAATWGHLPNQDFDPSPPSMRISINGIESGGLFKLQSKNGFWQEFVQFWDSQSSTQAVIRIRLATTAAAGNDLSLDDLSFAPEERMVADGGFEIPSIGTNQTVLFGAGAKFGGWMVEAGNVHLTSRSRWRTEEGAQALELNGSGSVGTVFQDLSTTPGYVYDLVFLVAGDVSAGPWIKTFRVWWGPANSPLEPVGAFTYDGTGQTLASLRWTRHSITNLMAVAPRSRIRFESTTPAEWGPGIDDVVIDVSLAPPANDQFENSPELAGTNLELTHSNVNASWQTGEPNHAGNAGGRSIWWTWVPPWTGQVTLTTHGSSVDTVLAVYTGSSLNDLVTVASNDNDPNGGTTSLVTFLAREGERYRMAADTLGGQAGLIRLHLALDSERTPQLQLRLSGQNVVLRWPINALDFTLEFSENLAEGSWTRVPEVTVMNVEDFAAKIPLTRPRQFYRLKRP